MYRRWIRQCGVLAAAVAFVVTVAGPAHAEQEPTGPVQPNIIAAAGYSATQPTIMPPGSNDWDCEPSEEHPNPVLLSNGTFANAYANWAGFSQRLADEGYCVFAGNFGGVPGGPIQTTGPIADTAKDLADFGDRILAATGAEELDVIGHSQGGMNIRHWIKHEGGAEQIDNLIGLSPSNHGTTLFGLMTLVNEIPPLRDLIGLPLPAVKEQMVDSEFIRELNAGGETVPGVDYTVIQTKYDEIVTPYHSAFLEPAPNVRNILVQDVCAQDFTDHVGITYDPISQRLALNALDPAGAQRPHCRFVPPAVS